MKKTSLIGGLAMLSVLSFANYALADDTQTLSTSNVNAESASQEKSVMMINVDTKQVVRVDEAGNVAPVTNEELQNLTAQADAQRAIDEKALRGGFGGGRGGFGGGGFHGGFGRGGFGGIGRGGFGRGGFGRGGFGGIGRGGFWRGGGWGGGRWHRRGWFGGIWAPYEPCDVYPYDPYYCY